MHKNSLMLADGSLMRDLIVLQQSRSRMDPSASAHSWHSPSVVDLLYKKGRLDVEKETDGKRLSVSSPPSDNFAASRVALGEASGVNEGVLVTSDRSNKSGARDGRREKSCRRSNRADLMGENKEPVMEQDGSSLPADAISGNSGLKNRKSRKLKGKQAQGIQVRILSEQLNDLPLDNNDVASSNVSLCGKHIRPEKSRAELEVAIRGHSSGLNRGRRRRGTRRARAAPSSREVGGQNELSVASNSFAQGSLHQKYGTEDEENEYDDRNVTRAPRNGCGVPFNWSRIHHQGKTILDIAGRSFSCGLSDSRLRKGRAGSHGSNAPEMPGESDPSSSSAKSEAEALPLLIEAPGSLDSTENARWVNDHAGELGIYANILLKHNVDSDLASETRFGEQRRPGDKLRGRHQNITQKYMPRTFGDLVGQNFVSQC